MVVLNLHAANFFAFKDFYINFAYPKKIVNSTIRDEHLSGCPNFRYKKLVVLMGANASGKTTFGKLLMSILNFITKREYYGITSIIDDKKSCAEFLIDIATEDKKLFRIETIIHPSKNGQYDASSVKVCVRSELIKEDDSYESCITRIEQQERVWNDNYIQELEKVSPLSWMFKYPGQDKDAIKSATMINEKRFIKVLSSTLKVLDPRIKKVVPVENNEDTYSIIYDHRTVMLKEGKVLAAGKTEEVMTTELIKDLYHMEAELIRTESGTVLIPKRER